MTMKLIFPESRQLVLGFRLNKLIKTLWSHQDLPRSIDPNFWIATVVRQKQQNPNLFNPIRPILITWGFPDLIPH